eukprot:8912890-Alexandrium_andersonii.AAC.1
MALSGAWTPPTARDPQTAVPSPVGATLRAAPGGLGMVSNFRRLPGLGEDLSLIHISEPTRLALI